MNYYKTQKNIQKAFSLIELSIVILIIGILVAGVTQSSRLVSQFRLISARNITLSSPVPTIKNLAYWLMQLMKKLLIAKLPMVYELFIGKILTKNTFQFLFVQNTVSDQPFYEPFA